MIVQVGETSGLAAEIAAKLEKEHFWNGVVFECL